VICRRRRGARSPKLVWLVLTLACATSGGCVSFEAVETTPESMLATIHPADVVRATLRDGQILTLRVRTLSDEFLRGQPVDDSEAGLVDIRLDRIAALELERPNLRKAMLTIFLPAVVGVAVICRHQDCRKQSVLIATP